MTARKHPLAKCEECPLFEFGEFVPSDGPDKAELAIVGEAPGYNEARTGKPFTGPSGKLLDTILGHYEIRRESTFLTNACLCREASGDNPPKAAVMACRPRLLDELKERNVGTAVALGNIASESLLNQTGITKLRIGPGRESRVLPGLRVIPTIHPAAALRAPDNFPFIVRDFGKINSDLAPWVPPSHTVVDNEQDAISALNEIDNLNPKMLVIDIESGIEKDTEFEHPNHHKLLCVGICYAPKKVLVLAEEVMYTESVMLGLGELLRKYPVGAQNGKSDGAGVYASCGAVKFKYDSLLANYTLDERPGIHDLEQMGVELLGTPEWKKVLRSYKKPGESYAVIPREVLYKYNAFDCCVTWDLIEVLLDRIDSQDPKDTYYLRAGKLERGKTLRDVHDFLIEASNELMFVELNGIAVDPGYIDVLAESFKTSLGFLEIKLNLMLPKVKQYDNDTGELLGEAEKNYDKDGGVNPRSPIQLLKVFRDFGMHMQSTDADTCKTIIEAKGEGSPVGRFCKALLEHRGETKDYGTYVEGIRKRILAGTTRVYPVFLLHGTTEGRLSCRNPNLQNIPRRSAIRRLFVPARRENVFVSTDYSQAELRVLCWLAGDRFFTPIFNEGVRDVFDELSENVLFPQYPKATTDKEFFAEVRSKWVKPFVYGLAYGRTEHGISGDIEIGLSLEEAKATLDKFMATIPEIVAWQKDIKKLILSGSDLVTPFGRHRRFHFITKQNRDDILRSGLAYVPASTSSDLCLRAFTRIRPDLNGIAWIRNLVHDSIIAECHKDDAEEVSMIMEKHFLDSAHELVGDFIKFAVETKVGHSWGDLN